DPRTVRSMLTGAAQTHQELLRRWPELARRFREDCAEITSFAAWERTFAENPAPERPQKPSSAGDRTA
ncbi:MAG: hypothetical protein Q4G40_04730, partial [Brachybacterium sp.]|nr:hypothetical protein [Brachybacterium sp.]